MILIKLGGSVITEKKKPLTPRKNAIEKIGRVISKSQNLQCHMASPYVTGTSSCLAISAISFANE